MMEMFIGKVINNTLIKQSIISFVKSNTPIEHSIN